MTKTTHVLDHGYVTLVDHMGTDLSVVRSARVSRDADWRTGGDEGDDARLIRYLWRNRHTSPFESVEFQFEVKAPIFVLRQWMRHRTWSYNEVSARYTKLPDEYYAPDPENVGVQSTSNKQGRTTGGDDEARAGQCEAYRESCEAAFRLYHDLISEDWPRELARCVLPVATYSRMFAKVDLLNLFKFLDVRLPDDAQYEIRVYAQAILDLIRPIVPVCVQTWEECRR